MTTPKTETTALPMRCQPEAHLFLDMARCQCGAIRVTPAQPWPAPVPFSVCVTPTLLLPENDDARMLHEIANALLVHQG